MMTCLKDLIVKKEELNFVKNEVTKHIIDPVLNNYQYPYEDNFIVNVREDLFMGGLRLIPGLLAGKLLLILMVDMPPRWWGVFWKRPI